MTRTTTFLDIYQAAVQHRRAKRKTFFNWLKLILK